MTEPSAKIAPIENYDPLKKFLVQVLGLSPISFAILIFLADLVVDTWIGWRFKVFLTTSSTPGIFQDYLALIVDFFYNPATAGLYLWSTEISTLLFQQLHNAKILKPRTEVINVVDANRPLFKSRLVFWCIFSLSLLFTISQTGGYLGWFPWKSPVGYIELHPSISFFRAPFWFLLFYAFVYTLFNVTLTIGTLRKIFANQDLKLQPLHPDRCGGLGFISQYTTKVALSIGAIGVLISVTTVLEVLHGNLSKAYPALVAIVGYIVLAPVFFFWPLGTAHTAMQEAKDAEMLELANQFANLYERVKRRISSEEEYENFERDIKSLENLRKLYEVAKDFPVWPFDIRSLSRFMTVITTPIFPAILSIVIEVAKTYVLNIP